MSADDNLRDALIEAMKPAQGLILESLLIEVLADSVLNVIKNWTVENGEPSGLT